MHRCLNENLSLKILLKCNTTIQDQVFLFLNIDVCPIVNSSRIHENFIKPNKTTIYWINLTLKYFFYKKIQVTYLHKYSQLFTNQFARLYIYGLIQLYNIKFDGVYV